MTHAEHQAPYLVAVVAVALVAAVATGGPSAGPIAGRARAGDRPRAGPGRAARVRLP